MSAGAEEKAYRAGTLTYDKRGLVRLFAWLLLGDFSMSVMAVALAKLLPLQLESMGVQAGKIGWMLSLGPLCSLVLSPFIGVWSDRLRTRWGRRRPFILISTPILALGLIAIPHIKSLPVLAVIILIVQVANVIETVVLYLYADVVPSHLMGRFMAGFRIVGILGALCFQYFLLPQFGTSPAFVWTVSALVYLVFYQLSIHAVREGNYAPPVKETGGQIVADYIKDGMGSRYIWLLWLSMGMTALATPAGYFIDIFSKREIGLDMATIGHMNAWSTLPALFLALPGGWVMDKFGPRLVWSVFSVLNGISYILGYVFVKDAMSMQIFMIAVSIFTSTMCLALMPMLYAHLPVSKFGQLTSTQSVIVQSLIFGSTNVLGQVIEWMGSYRFAIIWGAPFFLLTPLFVFLLSRTKSPFGDLASAMVKEPHSQAAVAHPARV